MNRPACALLGGLSLLFTACAGTHAPQQAASHMDAGLPGELRRTVNHLAEDIGERNCYRPRNLERSARWIEGQLHQCGYRVRREAFQIDGKRFKCADQTVCNVVAELPGTKRPDEIVAVGAHYDSRGGFAHWHAHDPVQPAKAGTPGANDNASGVAATLALARMLAGHPQERTLRFCFWVNEEPPFYQVRDADAMGSYVSAKRSRDKGEAIVAVVAFDTVGCYSPQPTRKRSRYPSWLLRWVGLPESSDYVAFVATYPNGSLIKRAGEAFSRRASMPVHALVLPYLGPKVAWSDDWSYTRHGYPAFCVTDTAFLRADHYHESSDVAGRLDYEPFARVVDSMRGVLMELGRTP